MDTRAIPTKPTKARASVARIGQPSPRSGRATPAALLADVRRLLRDGEVHDARRLAAEAVAEYPAHPGLRRTHEILNVGRSHSRPASGRSTRDELKWLRDPPDEYRGKWVAVIGRELVATADSLKELVARFPADLEQTPLAVQIAS